MGSGQSVPCAEASSFIPRCYHIGGRMLLPFIKDTFRIDFFVVVASPDLDFDCIYQQSASSSNTIIGKEYTCLVGKRDIFFYFFF
jgi:hypothetical protein